VEFGDFDTFQGVRRAWNVKFLQSPSSQFLTPWISPLQTKLTITKEWSGFPVGWLKWRWLHACAVQDLRMLWHLVAWARMTRTCSTVAPLTAKAIRCTRCAQTQGEPWSSMEFIPRKPPARWSSICMLPFPGSPWRVHGFRLGFESSMFDPALEFQLCFGG